jgi:hypothetical protein
MGPNQEEFNSYARGNVNFSPVLGTGPQGLSGRENAASHALSESGFFVSNVSLARMSDFLSGRTKADQVAVGSGCVHTHGVSAGVPVDTVGFYSAAAFVAKATNLNKMVILIAPAIARANESINLNDPETVKQLQHIEAWHRNIADKMKSLCAEVGVSVEVVIDRDLEGTEDYQRAKSERDNRCATLPTQICPYSAWQDLIFRTLHTSRGAAIKVGWTPHDDNAIRELYPSILSTLPDNQTALSRRLAISEDARVQGACEVAFDTNTRAMWPQDPIQACYIPAALTLEGKTVAPYTAKPIRNSGYHGRILLAQDVIDTLQTSLKQAILKHPDVALSFIRQCKTIHSVFPTLGVGISTENESRVRTLLEDRERTREWIQKPTKEDQCQKLSSNARTERHARKRAELAQCASELIAPRLEKLIRTFGI